MKLSPMYAAIAAALMAEATDQGEQPGAPNKAKPLMSIPEKVESWRAQGKKEGERVKAALEKGEMLAREVLLVYGETLAGEATANDFLTGYSSAWTNVNTAKVRKSEAKAVFDAFAIGDETREI